MLQPKSELGVDRDSSFCQSAPQCNCIPRISNSSIIPACTYNTSEGGFHFFSVSVKSLMIAEVFFVTWFITSICFFPYPYSQKPFDPWSPAVDPWRAFAGLTTASHSARRVSGSGGGGLGGGGGGLGCYCLLPPGLSSPAWAGARQNSHVIWILNLHRQSLTSGTIDRAVRIFNSTSAISVHFVQ